MGEVRILRLLRSMVSYSRTIKRQSKKKRTNNVKDVLKQSFKQ